MCLCVCSWIVLSVLFLHVLLVVHWSWVFLYFVRVLLGVLGVHFYQFLRVCQVWSTGFTCARAFWPSTWVFLYVVYTRDASARLYERHVYSSDGWQ